MQKTIALALLVGASFAAVPVLPAQAASSYPAKCVVLPLLQADCRAAIRDSVEDATARTRTVATTAAARSRQVEWPALRLLDCERAPAGSGHLYDC